MPAISLDMKKNRIAIHKTTLSLLGTPEYLQLIINPDKGQIVIRPGKAHDRFAIRVNYEKIRRTRLEFYSKSLMQEIRKTFTMLDAEDSTCRLYGTYKPHENIAVFPLLKHPVAMINGYGRA